LEKRGHWRKNWKERYFTLIPEERVLRYFSNSGQTDMKGEVQLYHDSIVEPYGADNWMDNHTHVFMVKGKQNNESVTHYLSATNNKTMQKWIEAIREVIHDGFPLIFQPKIWHHHFYCSSHVVCSFDCLTGSIMRMPLDSELKLSELRKPPLVTFSKPYEVPSPPAHHHGRSHGHCLTSSRSSQDLRQSLGVRAYSIIVIDPDLPPSGYLCWLVINVIDEDFYTGKIRPMACPWLMMTFDYLSM
jgi:hypothetical protein